MNFIPFYGKNIFAANRPSEFEDKCSQPFKSKVSSQIDTLRGNQSLLEVIIFLTSEDTISILQEITWKSAFRKEGPLAESWLPPWNSGVFSLPTETASQCMFTWELSPTEFLLRFCQL